MQMNMERFSFQFSFVFLTEKMKGDISEREVIKHKLLMFV